MSCSRDRGTVRTCEYGYDRFMDGLDSLLLENVAREQGRNQQHDQDEECP